ncbi:hypothetical protein OIU91_42360 (plasmid) [Streptomyces sp. NBC_01456]|uniref:hypothetical protein n=1 Tax=unclassified Streptomyces TaxID=2593676 RepID=UPI002E3697BD|nr:MULTISPECIES: hypothetical protein [unclassified Streptomyces]
MDPVSLNAVDEMDAARAALKQTTAGVLDAICAVLAGLYPEGKYFAVNNLTIYDANGRVTHGPRNRRGDIRYPLRLAGDWPLDRLPKRITRPHLGKHADSQRPSEAGAAGRRRDSIRRRRAALPAAPHAALTARPSPPHPLELPL